MATRLDARNFPISRRAAAPRRRVGRYWRVCVGSSDDGRPTASTAPGTSSSRAEDIVVATLVALSRV